MGRGICAVNSKEEVRTEMLNGPAESSAAEKSRELGQGTGKVGLGERASLFFS